MTEEYIRQTRSLFFGALTLFSFFMLALGLASCSNSLGVEDNVRETPLNNAIIPLEVGISWTYRVTSLAENGDQIGQVHRFVDVTQVHVINGEDWYRVSYSGDVNMDVLLSQRDDGIYRLWADDVARLYLADPATLGQKYTFPDVDRPGMQKTRRIEALDHIVRIDEEEYSCVQATDYLRDPDLPGWPFSTEHFYANGTGLVSVKQISLSPLDSPYLSELVELVKFSKQ